MADHLAGELVTADDRDNPIRAELRQGAAQTFTTAVFAAITFDQEDLDDDGGHTTNSKFTAVTAGWYLVAGGIGWASSATGIRVLKWMLNSATVVGGGAQITANSANVLHQVARTMLINMAVGDFLELHARQDSGGNLLSTVGTENSATMTLVYMGA